MKPGTLIIIITSLIFFLAFLFSSIYGIINSEIFKSKLVLSAYREGVASCGLTLKLREDKTFTLKEVCFGITDESGDYHMAGDTIYFEEVSGLKFAVIDNGRSETKSKAFLRLFREDVELPLGITFNELTFP